MVLIVPPYDKTIAPWVKQYFFVFTLSAILLGSLLAAKTVNHLIEAHVFLTDDSAVAVPAPKPRKRAAPVPKRDTTDVTAIVRRNVFCSSCPPLVLQPEAQDQSASTDPVETGLPIELVATMVSPDPYGSFAAIRNTGTSRTMLFREHSLLHGAPGVVVTSIEPKRVFLEHQGHPEFLDLKDGEAKTPRARAKPTRVSEKNELAAAVEKGVRKTSDDAYQVDRALITKILASPQTVSRAARIVPSIKDGQPNGFRLYRVRANSLYRKLGLRNGDTVHAINGQAITTADKALEVYAKLRTANHITLSLTRRGKPMTLEYTIR